MLQNIIEVVQTLSWDTSLYNCQYVLVEYSRIQYKTMVYTVINTTLTQTTERSGGLSHKTLEEHKMSVPG